MSQYFTLFQLEPAFDIDAENLEQTYRALAARFHPDKFASASAFEQKQAVMMSSTINAYLLKAQGIDADAPEHTSFAPEFLMQQMEWRETLMDAQMEQNNEALRALDQEISREQDKLYQDLRTAFAAKDYEAAAQWVRHGRFLNKLRNEIATALQD